MGKLESDNVKKLLKIRMRECKCQQTLGSFLVLMFFMNVINIITSVFRFQSDAQLISPGTYSNWGLILMLFACFYYILNYNEYNLKHQIFPQNSFTRFLSFELYCYFTYIIIQLFALGAYLLQYFLCLILDCIRGNVKFAYQFSPVYIIVGFFTYLFYGFIMISIIILVGSLVRKFKWLALIVYVPVLLILWISFKKAPLHTVTNFFMNESSPLLFFIKAVGFWAILVFLYHLVNSHTSLTLERGFNFSSIIISSIILISLMFSLLISVWYNEIPSLEYQDINNGREKSYERTYTIDADSLSNGSNLNVNIEQLIYVGEISYKNTGHNSTDNKIIIYFTPPQKYLDYIDMDKYTDLKLKATMNYNKLNISCTQDENIKVVAFYPYSLTQFDCFKDKPYAKNYLLPSMFSYYPGEIKITTPRSKNLSVQFDN